MQAPICVLSRQAAGVSAIHALIQIASCRSLISGMLTCRASTGGASEAAAVQAETFTSAAQIVQRPPPKRPMRSKRFQVCSFDPEELALHVEYYEPWPTEAVADDVFTSDVSSLYAGDSPSDERVDSSTDAVSKPYHLPSAYEPITETFGDVSSGHRQFSASHSTHRSLSPSSSQGLSDANELNSIRERGGYLTRQGLGRELITSRNTPSTRQRLGLGPNYEDEFVSGLDYRFQVGEHGRVADMVALKRGHVPLPFEHALPAGWSQAEWLAWRLEEAEEAGSTSAAQISTSGPPSNGQLFASGTPKPDGTSMVQLQPGRTGTAQSDWGHSVSDSYLDDGGPLDQQEPDAYASSRVSAAVVPRGRRYLPQASDPNDTNINPSATASNTSTFGTGPQTTAGAGQRQAVRPLTKAAGSLVLRAFTYCLGPSEVFHALWDLDLTHKVQFVGSVEAADFVLHRKARPGEQQFAYTSLRKAAAARRIPFVSVWDPTSASELRIALKPVFQLYSGQVAPEQVAKRTRGGGWRASRRMRI